MLIQRRIVRISLIAVLALESLCGVNYFDVLVQQSSSMKQSTAKVADEQRTVVAVHLNMLKVMSLLISFVFTAIARELVERRKHLQPPQH